MRVAQVIGQRIRDRRDELGMTQEEFGERVGHWLGKPWSRSTVSVAENGKRAFTGDELYAIACVLDTSPSRLLTPPYGVKEFVMPSGATMPAQLAFRNPGIVEGYLSAMRDDYAEALSSNDQAGKALRRFGDSFDTVASWAAKPADAEDRSAGEGEQ